MQEPVPGLVDPAELRRVMSRFATGVTVITSLLDGAPCGMTANSVTSVSLDPPLVLFCADEGSQTGKAVRAIGRFAVNILAEGQEPLSRAFAGKGSTKFDGVATSPGLHGLPLLDGALAWLACSLYAVYDGGDHAIIVGRVEGAGARDGASPLVFYRGEYSGLGR